MFTLTVAYSVLLGFSLILLILVGYISRNSLTSLRICFGVSFILISAAFALLGYCSIGDGLVDADYLRMVGEMQASQVEGISYLFDYSYSVHPGSAILLYLIGQTGNYALLKLISVLVFLLCLSFICYKLLCLKVSFPSIILGWLFGIVTIDYAGTLLNNIRFCLGAVMALTAIINLTFFKGMRIPSYLLMIIGGLIHFAVWPILLIYLLVCLPGKYIPAVASVIPLLFGLLVGPLSPILISLVPKLGSKLVLYFQSDSEFTQVLTGKMIVYYVLCIPLGYIILLYIRNNRKDKSISNKLRKFSLFVNGDISLGIALLLGSYIVRYISILPFMLVPLVVFIFSEYFVGSGKIYNEFAIEKSGILHFFFLLLLCFIGASFFFRGFFTYKTYFVDFSKIGDLISI